MRIDWYDRGGCHQTQSPSEVPAPDRAMFSLEVEPGFEGRCVDGHGSCFGHQEGDYAALRFYSGRQNDGTGEDWGWGFVVLRFESKEELEQFAKSMSLACAPDA